VEKGDNCRRAYSRGLILGKFCVAGTITTYLCKTYLKFLCAEFDINLVDKSFSYTAMS